MSTHSHPYYCGPVKAVIFDWAGTVIDYGSRAPVQAVMEFFRRCELPISTEQARGPMGMAKRDHLRAVLSLPAVQERWRKLHGRPSNDADVDSMYERFLPLQREILGAHAELIPGCLGAVEHCRSHGIHIGTSTGYTRHLMDVLEPLARDQGFSPDAVISSDDVEAGRPAPWMCLENARRMNVFPMSAIVNVDDTQVGVEAGRNAGMWSVGVAKSGNLVGLSEAEIDELDAATREAKIRAANRQLQQSGAHFVIDTVAELPTVLAEISSRLSAGHSP